MLEWDRNNLRKIRAHGIERKEAEEALANDPIVIEDQYPDDEIRQLCYSESDAGRVLGIVVTGRRGGLRVVTAYDLDRAQKRDYFARRAAGE